MRKRLIAFILALAMISPGAFAANTKVPAKDIAVNTTAFSGNLDSTDNTVQKCLETLDQILGGSTAISDEDYGSSWANVTNAGASKRALYEKIEALELGGNGTTSWGAILGNIASQTDLQAALNAKQNSLTFGNFSAGAKFTVTGGTSAVIGSGLSLDVASGYYLPSSADQTAWNAKQSAFTFPYSVVNSTGALSLSNDLASPGSSKYYGTDNSGSKGWFSLPTGSGNGTVSWGGILGTLSAQTDLQAALDAKQAALGYTPENQSLKSNNASLGNSSTIYPTQNAVKVYVDAGLAGKQATIGYTPENAANKANSTSLGTSDTLYPTQNAVKVYVDTLNALKQDALGFTPENVANKSTNTSLGTSNTLYPSQNAVKTYVDSGLNTKQNTIGYTPENQAYKSDNTSLGTNATLYPTQNAVKSYVDTAISALSSVYSAIAHNHTGVYEPVITAGTSSQWWLGNKTWQTKNTTNVPEGTNLYYTDARSRAAISAGTGMSYNSSSGVMTNTITQYTDALARLAISVTGAGSYNSTTGVITINAASQTPWAQDINASGFNLTNAGTIYANAFRSLGNSSGYIELRETGTSPTYITTLQAGDLNANNTQTFPTATGTLLNNASIGSTVQAYSSVLAAIAGASQSTGYLYYNGSGYVYQNVTSGANPAGSGSELQIRSNASSLGAVTNSSYADGVLTVPHLEVGAELYKDEDNSHYYNLTGKNGNLSYNVTINMPTQNGTVAVRQTAGEYNTSHIAEGSNLYYTDARARSSVSAGTGLVYNSTTGVFSSSITQYTDALARASLSAGAGISYNSTTGVITNTAGGHDAVTLAADADVLLGLSTQQITLDSQTANYVFAAPNGTAGDPTFRALVDADIPDTITASNYALSGHNHTGTYEPANANIQSHISGDADTSATNEIEVVDETYNATNFNGGTTSAVSQDDLYDYLHLGDTDDDGLANKIDLASAGFVKSNATGVLSVDTATYQPSDTDLNSWAAITPAANVDTFLATPSSSNLASAVTNETGSGALVFGTSPVVTLGLNSTIPSGASVTTDAAGEIGVRTGANMTGGFQVYGAASTFYPAQFQKSCTITNITNATQASVPLWYFPINATVRAIHATSSTGNANVTLQKFVSNATTGVAIDSSYIATNTSFLSDDGSLSNATIPAGSYVGTLINNATANATVTIGWEGTYD